MLSQENSVKDGIYQSVCRNCHGGCAARVHVKDGRVEKVTPAPGSPFNLSRMCVKGLATPEIMYHPDRLTVPLRRKGARGSGEWEPVSWDESLEDITARLQMIRKKHGPEAIALGQGTGRHHYMHVVRFANQLGTPNWYEPGLANCFIPRITVSRLTYGGFVTADYYGETNPETILFWGHNPLVSGPDGELSFPVSEALREGAFGIAVDPRRSETAKACQMWLPIKPGTDAALALGMIHVIIDRGFLDQDFVDEWTVGFDELVEHVKPFTPEWAAKITGVAPDLIAEAAKRYALSKPSVLEWGVAIEQSSNCLQNVRALAILRGLTGNLDVPGSDVLGMNILNTYPTLRNELKRDMLRKRIGADEFRLLGGFRAVMPSAHIPGLFRAMRTGEPYPVRSLLLFGNNPLTTVAGTLDVRESLLALDLLVATDLFMTPSAALADYVLPAACWPEINHMMELPLVVENAVAAGTKLVQVGECRQDEEIMIELARRMDLPGCNDSLEDIFNYRLEPLNITFQELMQKPLVFPPLRYRKYREKGFSTPSRKVELYSKALEKMGYDPLPTYKPHQPQSVAGESASEAFPYILITGARRRPFFLSEHRQIASLRKRHPDPVVELHPEAACDHEISDGDWIRVRSPNGVMRARARVTEDIRPDTVSVDLAWWFPERSGPDYGVHESNANMLTSNAPPYDPAFGSYQLRGLRCGVGKADT